MKILWLTWKDRKNPLAGGAEVVNEELAKRLVQDGHEVVFLVGGFKDALLEEIITVECHPDSLCHSGEGRNLSYKIIRLGGRWTVYWQTYKHYKKNLVGWADLVIDEINTIPFFAKFYVKEKNILFIHQLCRQIWFYEMFFPLSLIGYIIEPIYLWLLRDRKVITVSESTKKDLIKIGFKPENIIIISEGTEIPILTKERLGEVKKFDNPTILSLGSIRPMKRTDHIVKAFEIAKAKLPNLKLVIAGASEGKYGQKVLKEINNSKYKDSIEYLGRVSQEKKIELMQKAHLIAVTSVKEGWGLIVTEANSQGTPAVVYNADGLRDAVKNNETGLITKKNTPKYLATEFVKLLSDQENYKILSLNAWEFSKEINFERSYDDFLDIIGYN